MSQRTNGDKIHSGLSVGSYILQVYPSAAFHRNMPLSVSATRNRISHLLDGHVVQQDRFCAVLESFFQIRQGSHLDFYGLRTTPVPRGPVQHGPEASRQLDVIVLDEHPVRKIEAMIQTAAA